MQQFPQSTDPTSGAGARLFIGRLLETFFRRWWLYVAAVGALDCARRGVDRR